MIVWITDNTQRIVKCQLFSILIFLREEDKAGGRRGRGEEGEGEGQKESSKAQMRQNCYPSFWLNEKKFHLYVSFKRKNNITSTFGDFFSFLINHIHRIVHIASKEFEKHQSV